MAGLPPTDPPIVIPPVIGEQLSVDVSTVFSPGSNEEPGDFLLLSSDSIVFSLHRTKLASMSSNGFGGTILDPGIGGVQIGTSSEALNLLLHFVYGKDPASFHTTLELLEETFQAFSPYGLSLDWTGSQLLPLKSLFLRQCHMNPIQGYAIAASNNWESLAVEVSALTLASTLSHLTEAMCDRMGSTYLRRLMFLRLGRVERLKLLMIELPHTHPRTEICGEVDQKHLQHQWHACSSSVLWNVTPNYPIILLRETFSPLIDGTSCELCKDALKAKIRKLIIDWDSVKRTI